MKTIDGMILKSGETRELSGQLRITGEGLSGYTGGDLTIRNAEVVFGDGGSISGNMAEDEDTIYRFENVTFRGRGNTCLGCFDVGLSQFRFEDCTFEGIKGQILDAGQMGHYNPTLRSWLAAVPLFKETSEDYPQVEFDSCLFRDCLNKKGELFRIYNDTSG